MIRANMAVIAATLVAGCASVEPVPAALQPAGGERLALTVPAQGVQIYECRAAKSEGTFEWAFVAPDADLFDIRSRRIGHHGAGPYWEASDGSRVVGSVKARAAAPVDGAVPWLLLSAKSTGAAGRFSAVTSIQRINTRGGIAPSGGCDRTLQGTRVRVPYTADYLLFVTQ